MPIKKVALVDLGDAEEDLRQSIWVNLLLLRTALKTLRNPSLAVGGEDHAADSDEDF